LYEWSKKDVEIAKQKCDELGFEFMTLDVSNDFDVNRVTRRIVKQVVANQ
jgi:tRNA U34 2-thiouridine synthase MnmA/TrmU